MAELYFTKNGYDWDGGFFELAIEIGPPSDDKLYSVLHTVWQHPTLEGCYLEPNLEPSAQERKAPSKSDIGSSKRLLGLATMPNGKRIACGTILMREDNGSDWLDFFLPLGSLSEAYAVGAYPFGDIESARIWQHPIEAWLASVAVYVFQLASFQLGLIGFEALGESHAKILAKDGIPPKRLYTYLWPDHGQLQHFPQNVP